MEGPSWELTRNRVGRCMEACPLFSSEEAGRGNLARADSGCPTAHSLSDLFYAALFLGFVSVVVGISNPVVPKPCA